MTRHLIHLLLGVVLFACTAVRGAAAEAWLADAEARTEAVAACALDGEDDRRAAQSVDDAAILPSLAGEAGAESNVGNDNEGKREVKRGASRVKSPKSSHRRTSYHRIFFNKCRNLCSLSPKALARGVAKHPENQDAGQERTAAVRFLQMAALVC